MILCPLNEHAMAWNAMALQRIGPGGEATRGEPERIGDEVEVYAKDDFPEQTMARARARLTGEYVPGHSHLVHSHQMEQLLELIQIPKNTPQGCPLYKLHLRIGCIVVLMRNLSISEKLMNGVRLKLTGNTSES